jgi:hypothetical protein
MEQCRLCLDDAAVVMILDDGTRVPYRREHMPAREDEEVEAYDRLILAIRGIVFDDS